MAYNPSLQIKLRKEILSTIPDMEHRVLTAEDVDPNKTPYLEAVVHESLRCGQNGIGFARSGENVHSNDLYSPHLAPISFSFSL